MVRQSIRISSTSYSDQFARTQEEDSVADSLSDGQMAPTLSDRAPHISYSLPLRSRKRTALAKASESPLDLHVGYGWKFDLVGESICNQPTTWRLAVTL